MAALADWFDRHCDAVYVVMALPMMIWFALWVPAFQSPDESNHFARAALISSGTVVGTRFGATDSGGWVDASIPRAEAPYSRLPFNPAARVTAEEIAASRQFRWSGELTLKGFRNTVNYGPLFYLPQAIGVWSGRQAGLSVIDTVVLARIVNGLACCALGFLALRWCAFGRCVMFSVLCWPMALFLSASSSHDGLLIASGALMIAIASRVSVEDRRATPLELTFFLIALVGGVTGRPPHLAFALLLPLLLRRAANGVSAITWRTWSALLAAAAICAVWIALVQAYTMPPTLLDVPEEIGAGPSIGRQIAFLRSNPGVIPTIVYRTIVLGWKPLITTSIGVLGWLDTLMPSWYYWLAAAIFVVALAADRRPASPVSRRITLAGSTTLLAFTVFTYGSIYLTWMGVGAMDVLGVQGRYLLAGVPLLAWLLPGRDVATATLEGAAGAVAWILAVTLVVVTYLVVPAQVVARYYGQ